MKLVIGLGNPGKEYVGTRHNVGFEVIDGLAKRHDLDGTRTLAKGPGAAIVMKWRRAEEVILLATPFTFMNLSGQAVRDLCQFYKIALPDVLVLCDDVNLPLGRLRARASGSEGGHNGLRSVAEHLGTIEYARLRLGVGRGDARRDLADHVLARFESEELPAIAEAVSRAADAVEMWIVEGLPRMMNAFNRVEDN
jgi:peptidyl-tRNA hydrolase, PTH1 family